MSSKADFNLVVGAEISASYEEMRKDLKVIINTLNKQPYKIKLGLDMASASKDVNKLKTDISELSKSAANIKFSDQISTSLSGITTNLKTLTDSVSGVSGLRDALQSLSEAMRSFQGINLNLGLSGNSINRNAAYGNAARSAIVELERQITAIEQAYARFYNMTDARSAAFRGATSVFGINTAIETRDALGAGNLNEQVTALTRYISMLQVAANHINGLDLSPVNAQFEHTATEIMHNVERVANGEVELNNNTERLRGIFSSGINAEALNEQLNTISASISNASNAMGALGLNEESLNSFRAAINEIVELINQLIASVEKVNTTVSGLAPRDIVNRDSLEQAVATVNEATQATQVLGNTMGATASRAQEVTKAAQDVATATRGNVAASNELNTSISNLGTTMQAIEDTRIQEIANAELLREAQAEEEAYTNRANTALQNQIDMMLGIGRETKSAEQSMEAFIAAEDEANRTFQNIRTAEPQLKKIADAATKARTFLNSNMEASESPSYQKAITSLERLEIVMEACGTDANNLHSVLRDTGINSTFEIERLNSAISTLRNELVNTGSTGTVSLRNIVDVMNQMQNLAGGNTNLSGAQSFIALTNEIERFQQIVESCGGDATRLEGVLREMGVNGVNEIEAARLAMSNFRTDVVQATNTERANADATREAADARREEERVIRTGATAYRQHAAVALQAENKLRQWSAAERSANQESRNAYANLYNSVRALDAAATAYDGTEDSARNLAAAVQNTRTTLKESERVLKANGEATQTFGDRLKGLAQKFSAWLSVSQVIMYAVRTVRKMISTSVELDSAMSQMRIVTNATESDMKRFGDTVAETAKRIGASMTDLIDSATVFARLGYSLDESSSLAEYTSMLQKVGDIDVSDAQNAITAITKAYDDIDADNIESTMDKLVKVGNSFPISTAEIAEGLNNAASSLSAAGNTFEESVALLTAANTTVDYCRAA